MIALLFLAGAILWLAAAIMLSKRIPRWLGATKHAKLASVLLFPLILVLPVADEIVGNIYMVNVACKNATSLTFLKPIDEIKKARLVNLPDEAIWFAIPINKLQVNYLDVDSNETFAYSISYVTYGGVLSRLGLNLGQSGNCNRWTTSTRHHVDPSPQNVKLNQLLKNGEGK